MSGFDLGGLLANPVVQPIQAAPKLVPGNPGPPPPPPPAVASAVPQSWINSGAVVYDPSGNLVGVASGSPEGWAINNGFKYDAASGQFLTTQGWMPASTLYDQVNVPQYNTDGSQAPQYSAQGLLPAPGSPAPPPPSSSSPPVQYDSSGARIQPYTPPPPPDYSANYEGPSGLLSGANPSAAGMPSAVQKFGPASVGGATGIGRSSGIGASPMAQYASPVRADRSAGAAAPSGPAPVVPSPISTPSGAVDTSGVHWDTSSPLLNRIYGATLQNAFGGR